MVPEPCRQYCGSDMVKQLKRCIVSYAPPAVKISNAAQDRIDQLLLLNV